MPTAKSSPVAEIEPVVQPVTPPASLSEKPILVAEAEPEAAIEPPTLIEPQPEPIPTPTSSDMFGPVPAESKAGGNKLFWIIIAVFAVLGVAAGGIGIYLQNRSKPTPLASPAPEVSPLPSSSPEVQLNRKDLQIQVLNGSGVVGAAKKAQDYLEGLGYKVAAVGNASSSDYTTTQISLKDSKKDYLSILKKDLLGKYDVANTADSLEDNSKYDAVIILGTK